MRSVRSKGDCDRAASLLNQGFPIGAYVRGVCGLWADGQHEEGLNALYRIKGAARGNRPVGTTLPFPSFIELLDPDGLSPKARELVFNENLLVGRLGSLCFLRAPLKPDKASLLPERVYSRTKEGTFWIQNWLPEGCKPTGKWMESIQETGISLPVATSMNLSGQPEIVDQEEGEAFCQTNDVPMFLRDPENPGQVQGSFPIIQVDSQGIKLLREGHFPPSLFQKLLAGWEIDLFSYENANYPLSNFPRGEGEEVDEPSVLRQQLLQFMDG